MFRRRPTATAVPAEPATAQGSGKGRPTPKRREAEATRKAASKPPLDRREAYRRQRELARHNRLKTQEAMRGGAEALYPPRDRGPVRRFVRDYVDSRRSVAEFFLPLAFLILLASLVPSTAVQAITSTAFLAAMILVITDTTVLGLRLRRELRRRFPADSGRGHLFYGLARSTQLRRFRLPKPRIKPGASPADAPLAAAAIGSAAMEFRFLGRSGLKVSEIAYGNWLTHGSQVEEEAAQACVQAALDAGVTTFDTADVYANTKAEEVLGRALAGQRRESLEILTKVYWPTGPGGPNDAGLSRKHIMESIEGSLRRLQTEYVDVYQAHRFDVQTPLEETMLAFADVVRSGKALYIGVSEWTAEQIRAGAELARELRVPFISNQPHYNMLWRVIEAEIVPTCEELGLSQIVWSPILGGVLTGKYQPGEGAPAGSRGADPSGSSFVERWLREDVLRAVQALEGIALDAGLSRAQLAVAWTLQNPKVASAIIGASRPEQVEENVKAVGVRLEPELLARIDEALGDLVERDPAKTASPEQRPGG